MRLQIDISFPNFELYNRFPDVNIQQDAGGFEAKYYGPEIEIEQQEAMREIGFIDLPYMVKQSALAGKQAVLSGIARIAREGDRMMDALATGEKTIALLARESMFSDFPEINVDASPKTPPKIRMDYELEIKWHQSRADINFQTYPPRLKWHLGKVDITVVKGTKFDVRG